MTETNSSFLDRMRERAAKMDEAAQIRLDQIKQRPERKPTKNPESPSWISAEIVDTGKKKKSILDMLHGDITTKSPTQRS